MTMKKKKDLELMNDSSDMDRDFNPFQRKSVRKAANISISSLSSIDQVIFLKLMFKKYVCIYIFFP